MFRQLATMGYTHQGAAGMRTEDVTSVLPGLHLVASLLSKAQARPPRDPGEVGA